MANLTNICPKALLGLLVIVLLPILAACSAADNPMTTWSPKSDVANSIQDLYMFIFWIAVAVFIIVESALLYAVIKFRRRPTDGMPRQVHGNTVMEITWTIIPALILVAIAIPTWMTIFEIDDVPEDAYMISIIGHQWWWEVTYPTGEVTANEIHVPSNRTIGFTLETADVLHSFWVPQLFGKQDIVPGRIHTLWFTPEEEGLFLGQCVEFCGISHANMRLELVVDSPAAFAAWTAGLNSPAPAASGLAAAGYDAFANKGCVVCHTISGRNDAVGVIGPNLSLFGSRLTLASATLPNTVENLTAWLTDPEDIKPGNIMAKNAAVYTDPDLELTGADVAALVAYLHSLK
jgi:cytochrome c oxidase subunit 2